MNRSMKIAQLIVLVATVVLVSSCCSCRIPAKRSTVPITGGEWQVVQMDGVNIKAEGDSFTLTFKTDNTFFGKGDCNRLTGGYKSDNTNGTLSFGGVASTRMFCPKQAGEDKFIRLLNETDGYTIDGNMLMFFTNGELKLMFERKGK